MRLLVTGGAGVIGGALARSVAGRWPAAAVDLTWRSQVPAAPGVHHRVDLCDADATRRLFEQCGPDLVVHTAYRAGSRGDIVEAAENVAAAAARVGAGLVHLSTDVVFDGDGSSRCELDPPCPINDYGRWKLEAEQVVTQLVPNACVTRSSIVVRLDPPDAGCATALAVARGEHRMRFFDDEIRLPILLEDLVGRLVALIELPAPQRSGVWHLPGPEAMSRSELARRIVAYHGVDPSRIDGVIGGSDTGRPRDLRLTSIRSLPGASPARRIPRE